MPIDPNEPTVSPSWATDTNYPAGVEPEAGTPTKVEPTAGKKAIGFRPEEYPPAQYFNWFMWLVAKWIQFLSSARLNFFELHQNWCAPMLAAWTQGMVNGATFTKLVDPSANKPCVWGRMRVPGDAAASGVIYSERVASGIINNEWNDDLMGMIELTVDATAFAGTANDYYAKIGLCHDENMAALGEDAIAIYKDSANANWLLKTYSSNASAETSTDTGVAATGIQLLRFEIYGTNWTGGRRVDLYIDGVLAATNTTNLPSGQEMSLLVGVKNDSVLVANLDLYVSPMTYITRRLV